ncbi:MAG: hypothetical protein ACK55I_48020, partial [bacterium]
MRSWRLSGHPRPVRLQALHSRPLLLRNRPLRSRRRLPPRLLLNLGRVVPVLPHLPRRTDAA